MAAREEFEPSLSGWLTAKTYDRFMKLEEDVFCTSTALKKQGEKLYKFRNFFLKELLEIGKDKKTHKNLEEKDQEKDVISLDSSPSPTLIRSSSPSSNSSNSDQFTTTKKSRRRKGRRVQTYQGHMAKRQMLKRNPEKERGTTKKKEPMNDIQLPSVFSDDENSTTEVSEPCHNETKTPCVQDSAVVNLKKFSLILEKIHLPTNECSPETSGTERTKEQIETLTEDRPSSPQTSEASIEIPFQGRGNESLDSPKPVRRNPKRKRCFDDDDDIFNNDNDKILETPEKKMKAIEDKLGLKSCRDLFSSDEMKSTQSQKLSMEDNEIEKSNEPTKTTEHAEEDIHVDSEKVSLSPDWLPSSSPSSHSTYQCSSPRSIKKSSPKPTRISPRKSLRPRRLSPSENESKRITRSQSIHTSSNCINTEGSSELDSALLKCPSHPPPRTSSKSTKKKDQKEKELPKSVDEEEHSNLSTEVSAVSRSMRYFNTEDTTQSTDPPPVKTRLRVTRASMLPSKRQSESLSSHTSSLGESKLGISSILRRRKTLLTAKLGTTSFLTDTFAEEEKSRSSGHTSIRINARSFVAPKLKMSKKEGTL